MRLIIVFIFLAFSWPVTSQIKTVHIKKDFDQLYFFQKGNKRDTVSRNNGDTFYLLVPDSLKENLLIELENAQLRKTTNDSIVTLIYTPGLRYEASWKRGNTKHTGGTGSEKPFEFQCLINGISEVKESEIKISFRKRNALKPLLDNKFYYKK